MRVRISATSSVYLLSLIVGLSSISCDIDIIANSSNDRNVENTDYSASAEFSFDLEAQASQRGLRLDAINGSVEIVGVSDTDSIGIWGERRVESESTADAAHHLQNLSVVVREESDEIVVRTEQPRKTYGRNYLVDYHIYVPETWRIFAEHINGNVALSSIDNRVNIKLVNGNISIHSSHGTIEVELVNGSMRLWDISGSVDGELINGNIDGKIVLAESGTCRLKTVNGKINLSIPQFTSAIFSAEVANGTIFLSDLVLKNQHVAHTRVTGRLGDGDGQIDLDTVNGNIVVVGF